MVTEVIPVVIVGAGVSGLVAAWQLRQKGIDVRVLESENRAGGSVRSEQHASFVVDLGPNTALDTKPCIREIVNDLGLQSEIQYASDAAKNRYIVRNGKLNALPTSPGKFLASCHFSWKAKARLALEPFIPADRKNDDVSLAHFVTRRLGKEFLDYAIDPFVAGIFAGDPYHLSVRSGFPKLLALEQKYGSILKGAVLGASERKRSREVSKASAKMFSFRGGMQKLTDTLAQSLGKDLRLSHCVDEIVPCEEGFRILGRSVSSNPNGEPFSFLARKVVMAVPAYRASQLVKNFADEASQTLNSIYYPPVSVVFHGMEKRSSVGSSLDGFGYLIPKLEARQTLGTLWSSTLFPDRAPLLGAAFTTFVGGARSPRLAFGESKVLHERAWRDVSGFLKISEEPTLTVSHTWKNAIPQYKVGHHLLVQKLETVEKQFPGFYFLGNYRGGVSMSDCMGNATQLAAVLAEEAWK